eukprot:7086249-Pyramimonas_sp.AAC.1
MANDAPLFDVLRAILSVSLGHASDSRGLCQLALWGSGRRARCAGSARSVGARRPQGVGPHRKSGSQRPRDRADRQGADDVVGRPVVTSNEGAEIVGRRVLRVAVARAARASPA